ncbi:cytochrome P450 6B5-like [Battus philenor]|uniref:cytochrome P450 6B5-like n=1 Tax=Battus philenor TaxID=42288 RepID=UPI0035CF7AD4
MFFTYLLVASVTLVYLFHWYATRTYDYWKKRNVTGPPPAPLFGNLLDSALRRKNIAVVHKEIYEAFPNEKMVGMYRMTTPCLMLRDLDMIKSVLIKDFDLFSDRGVSFSEKGLGNNLFHADSEKWRILRSRFSPVFTSGKLKNMVHLLEHCGDRFIDYLRDLCSARREHEVHSLIQRYTVSSISACAFGMDLDSISGKQHILKKIDNLIFSPTFIDELDMMFPGILRKLKIEPFPKEIPDFFEQLVATVLTQRQWAPSSRNDFMDLILELRQQGVIQGNKRTVDTEPALLELTNDIIAAQAFVFYAGGYETSANTMSFMLYELAKSPDVQEKLIAEVDEVLKKYDGKMTYEALSEMPYMDKVLAETLRLYPIVDPLQRRAQQDYTIPGTEVTVKKGQLILISTHGIHRDEKHYPDPEKFDPERFSPENSSARHTCAYMPFGTGPRSCIGLRFAKLQSRMCIAKVLSEFRVQRSQRTAPDMRFGPRRFILASAGGNFLNIIPRKT